MVGDAVRQHRGVDAQYRELVGAEQRPPVGRRRHLRPDEDSRGTVAQRVQIPPGVLAALPGAAEKHPDLRIHVGHLGARDPEEAGVHPLLSLVAYQPFVRAAESPGAGEFADRLVTAAVPVGYRFPDDLAFAEEAPEVIVRADSPRHTVGIPDNGDRTRVAHEAGSLPPRRQERR